MEMVGIMAGNLREQAVSLLNDAKMQADTSAKTDLLKRLKEVVLHRDPALLSEFVPHLMELQTDPASPVRNFLAQIIEEIGLKQSEHIPAMVPVLLHLMQDEIPGVARRAISTGSNLFRVTFEKVALQGLYSGYINKQLEESWIWINKLKDAIYVAAQEHKSVRLLAIKFVETVILLFTPDPSGSAQAPPLQQNLEGRPFNVAWLVGGHPLLDVGALGQEASKNLALLLDQLRIPEISKLPGPVFIVLLNSLASIAKRRPSLYGRVLPVLLGLGPNCEAFKGAQVASVVHALKNAFLNLLKCTHSGAGPWRERLVSALRAMNAGDMAEAAVRQMDKSQRSVEREYASRDSRSTKDERMERKRASQENGVPLVDVDDSVAKRVRMTPTAVLAGSHEPQMFSNSQDAGASHEMFGLTLDSTLSPLQQMIAMIGALVAKGDRANPSIDILIASLPADMLADVVIENMRNLPATPPAITSGLNTSGSTSPAPSLSTQANTSGSLGGLGVSASSATEVSEPVQGVDHRRDPRRDPRRMDPRRTAAPVSAPEIPYDGLQPAGKGEDVSADIVNSSTNSLLVSLKTETVSGTSEHLTFIPGISESLLSQEVLIESTDAPAFNVVTPPGTISEATMTPGLAISLSTVAVSLTPPLSLPVCSEEKGPSLETPMDASDATPLTVPITEVPDLSTSNLGTKKESVSSTGVLSGASTQSFSSIPVVYIDADQQAALWKSILTRILESYRLIGPAGGSELRLSLLARLIAQLDGDDDALSILQKHILADYQNHKGHELAIYTLYQLYAEKVCHEPDSGIATMVSTFYDNFFISVVQGLRDTLPASDRSLSRLLSEAPVLPDVALKFLEHLCNPETKERLETLNVDRITQGLTTVWSLILLRPPIRAVCLDIALKCAVHEVDEVRTKAIRLVANKLYPLPFVSQKIEEFATKMLHIVVEKGFNQDLLKNPVVSCESPTDQVIGGAITDGTGTAVTFESLADEDQEQKTSKSVLSVQEAQRCTSLYFALCTKKHSLLREIFNVYEHAPKAVRQAVHRHTPVLIKTIGSSSTDLMNIISDPPIGSKNLILRVLHILADSSAPSTELIAAVKQLYELKIKDARLLTPILSSLSKEEVLPIFPQLVALPSEDFKAALDRILQGSVHTGPALTPAEVLIAIHGIDPERDHIPLSKVKDACAVCFQQRTVFTQQVLAKVLNQLVEQTPLPMLFMRTVILAVGSFRSLVSFVMEILSRLVSKQIWKWPNLWIGFLKCADQTQPLSFHVLLQLPAVQLEKALNRYPNLRAPLTAHASKSNVRSTLPRSTLVVLGLAQDAIPAEPAISVQSAGDHALSTATGSEMQAAEPSSTT